MRATLLWILALFAAFSWVACWEELQIVRLRRELAAQHGLLEDSGTRLGQMGRRLHEAESREAAAELQLASVARRQAAAAVDAGLADRLKQDDEYAAILRQDERRRVVSEYRDELAEMALPPDTLAKLKNLLVARSEAPFDARDAAKKQGLPDNAPETAEAEDQVVNDVNRDIATLLGPAGYEKFQTLTTQAGYRNEVQTQVGTDLADAGQALTPEQTSSLAQIYYEADNSAEAPPEVAPADAAVGLTGVDEVVIGRASRMLAPAQVRILRADRIERHRREAVGRKWLQANPAPPPAREPGPGAADPGGP